MSKYILGIQSYANHDSGACIIKFSGDKSPMMDAILDALAWLDKNKNLTVDAVLLLQPTSPLRKTTDILNALKSVEGENYFSIVSVTRMREHPYECIEMKEKLRKIENHSYILLRAQRRN